MKSKNILMILFAVLIFAGTVYAEPDLMKAALDAAIKNTFNDQILDRYLQMLPRIGDYYIVEGDIPFTRLEMIHYLVSKNSGTVSVVPNGELSVMLNGGVPSYWKDLASRRLKYSVDRDSFATAADYQNVVAKMRQATGEWQAACSDCGLEFVHESANDANPSHSRVTFIVKGVDTGGAYIASAFFPHYAEERRYINIDRSFFDTDYDQVGVLRHELGHVIGYRHEHIRDISGCYKEDNDWKPLTQYDPKSVMHYFCGGGGTLDLKLSSLDVAGHKLLYKAR